jgi:hypothetical protein
MASVLTSLAAHGGEAQDVAGSHDHPSLARVPGYYIAAYNEMRSDHADFCVRVPKQRAKVTGRCWRFTYRRARGGTSLSGDQVRAHYRTLFKKAHATPICDADPDLDARLPRDGGGTWVHLRAFAPGDSYELEIIERETP